MLVHFTNGVFFLTKSKAFTLIELLIVMAVIAILIAIAIPSFRGMQQEANKTRASGDVRVLKEAIEAYYKDYYKYPTTGAAWQDPLTGASPQIITKVLTDPFNSTSGTPYTYITSTPYYLIYSVGSGGSGTATFGASTTGQVTAGTGVVYETNGR